MKHANLCIFLLLALTLATSSSAGLSPFTKYHVKIVNNLPESKSPLRVHCKSKDDDLGDKLLTAYEETEWSFRVNFSGSTLFFCNLSYRYGGLHRAVFDVFRANEEFVADFCGTNTCTWIAQEAGIYAYNSKTDSAQLTHLWTNGGESISPEAQQPPSNEV